MLRSDPCGLAPPDESRWWTPLEPREKAASSSSEVFPETLAETMSESIRKHLRWPLPDDVRSDQSHHLFGQPECRRVGAEGGVVAVGWRSRCFFVRLVASELKAS